MYTLSYKDKSMYIYLTKVQHLSAKLHTHFRGYLRTKSPIGVRTFLEFSLNANFLHCLLNNNIDDGVNHNLEVIA